MRKQIFSVALIFVLGFTLGGGYLLASHQWNCFHWQTTDLTYDGPTKDKGGKSPSRVADYENAYDDAVALWDSTVITLSNVNDGNIHLLYRSYGRNGWLGLASIFVSGCHITDGTSKLNATFLDDTSTYSFDDICHVACQEVGHTLGLDHNRSSNTTCMNDTVLIGCLINNHDRQLLADIYAHTPD